MQVGQPTSARAGRQLQLGNKPRRRLNGDCRRLQQGAMMEAGRHGVTGRRSKRQGQPELRRVDVQGGEVLAHQRRLVACSDRVARG